VTRAPTRFPELNDVLRELVEGIRGILGESFCGAYLQGSFALGDADEHSDVDFLIVTREEIGDEQLAQLQPMHRRT
jgi:predicted nucleotidyltransferase